MTENGDVTVELLGRQVRATAEASPEEISNAVAILEQDVPGHGTGL